MRSYALQRLGQAVIVMLAAYVLAFLLLSALPGNAIESRVQNPGSGITAAEGKQLIAYYGLDRPLPVQFLREIGGLLHGSLGFSLQYGTSVNGLIAAAIPPSLVLIGVSLVVGLVASVVIAVVSTNVPRLRDLFLAVPPLLASLPTFLTGLFFIEFFSFRFRLVPAVSDGSAASLVGPALTLGFSVAAPIAQVLIRSIERVQREPFVQVAIAKGGSTRFVFVRHVLKNASLPALTLAGLIVGELVGGTMVIESVFSRNGLGTLTENAVQSQDLPVVQGVVVVAAATYVVINLLVDLSYPLLDPRLRSSIRDGAAA